jgi:hypothetical protein
MHRDVKLQDIDNDQPSRKLSKTADIDHLSAWNQDSWGQENTRKMFVMPVSHLSFPLDILLISHRHGNGCRKQDLALVADCSTLHRHMASAHAV